MQRPLTCWAQELRHSGGYHDRGDKNHGRLNGITQRAGRKTPDRRKRLLLFANGVLHSLALRAAGGGGCGERGRDDAGMGRDAEQVPGLLGWRCRRTKIPAIPVVLGFT